MRPRPRIAVARLADYDASDLALPVRLVRAHCNENALGAPQCVVNAVRAMGADDFACYPGDRHAHLLECLARHVGVERDRVAAGNGADEVLSALIDSYASNGDRVAMMDPSFAWYSRFAARSGAEIVKIPYSRRWQVEAADLLGACDGRTRVLLLGNPNNPTGDLLPSAVLPAVLDALPATLVVVDETYIELSDQTHARELAGRDNLAIVRSMSKTPGLAGLRLGYLAASKEIAATVRRWLQPYAINVAAAVAALAYFNAKEETRCHVAGYRALVSRSLAAIGEACGPLALEVYPSAANFVLVDFGERIDFVAAALEGRGIRMRRYAAGCLRTCLRITAQDDVATAAIVGALQNACQVLDDA